MGILTETLGGRSTYGARPRRRSTQGKIIPVPKRPNPYTTRSRVRDTDPRPDRINPTNPNLLGSLAQIKNQGKPVSTAISVNYESDPVLARIKALNSQNVANAQTEAQALRKQAIIDTGMDDVGKSIGLDDSTLEAARQNPFSVRKNIERTSLERGRELDESLNQQNLFFSGHRANQLGDLAHNTAEAQTRAGADLRGVLGGIDAGVLEAQQRAYQEEQLAMQEAAFAAQEAAMQQAYMDALASMLSGGYEEEVAPPLTTSYDPIPGVGYTDIEGQMVPMGAARWDTLDQAGIVDEYALAQALGLV